MLSEYNNILIDKEKENMINKEIKLSLNINQINGWKTIDKKAQFLKM